MVNVAEDYKKKRVQLILIVYLSGAKERRGWNHIFYQHHAAATSPSLCPATASLENSFLYFSSLPLYFVVFLICAQPLQKSSCLVSSILLTSFSPQLPMQPQMHHVPTAIPWSLQFCCCNPPAWKHWASQILFSTPCLTWGTTASGMGRLYWGYNWAFGETELENAASLCVSVSLPISLWYNKHSKTNTLGLYQKITK